nr:hypothetical protein [Ktedonobacteraceae bacterium]
MNDCREGRGGDQGDRKGHYQGDRQGRPYYTTMPILLVIRL